MIREFFSTVGLFFASLIGLAPETATPPPAPAPIVHAASLGDGLQVPVLPIEAPSEPAILGTTTAQQSPTVVAADTITRAELDAALAALRSEVLAITATGLAASSAGAPGVSSDFFRLQVDRIYDSLGRSINNTSDRLSARIDGLTAGDVSGLDFLPLTGGALTGGLDVQGVLSIQKSDTSRSLTLDPDIGIGSYSNGGDIRARLAAWSHSFVEIGFSYSDGNGYIDVKNNNSWTGAFGGSNLNLMRNGGNVGIGLTNPTSALEIVGNLGSSQQTHRTTLIVGDETPFAGGSSASGGGITFRGITNFGRTTLAGIWAEHDNYPVSSNTKGALFFMTRGSGGADNGSAAPDMVLRNDRLGIGTTSPWRTLSVTGTAAFDGLGSTGGTQTLCLTANKEVVTNNGECVSSSEELKEDIQTISLSAADMVSAMRPVSFKYLDADRPTYGFIAEDVAEIDNRFIGYFDQSRSPRTINTASILAVTVKAVQELANRITWLFRTDERHDAELAELRARVSELEARAQIVTPPPTPPPPSADTVVAEDEEDTDADATTLSDHATLANPPHDDTALVE